MILDLTIGKYYCRCYKGVRPATAFILSPMSLDKRWVESAGKRLGINIAVITGMDWDNDLTPWPAPGAPHGCPDFEGKAAEFLEVLSTGIVPQIENATGTAGCRRSLVGISLSGLFTLWQWLGCDVFSDIACVSASFWYPGFAGWVKSHGRVGKTGRAYFSLGDLEHKTNVPQFRSVATDTEIVVDTLKGWGIDSEFFSVPGNHYQHGIERLDKALAYLHENV